MHPKPLTRSPLSTPPKSSPTASELRFYISPHFCHLLQNTRPLPQHWTPRWGQLQTRAGHNRRAINDPLPPGSKINFRGKAPTQRAKCKCLHSSSANSNQTLRPAPRRGDRERTAAVEGAQARSRPQPDTQTPHCDSSSGLKHPDVEQQDCRTSRLGHCRCAEGNQRPDTQCCTSPCSRLRSRPQGPRTSEGGAGGGFPIVPH